MFTINMYISTAEKNRLNKDGYLTAVGSFTGVLKTGTSILSPTILVEGSISIYSHANYCYIEAFSRYYFVSDIKSMRDDLIEISLHCDVLMTYKDSILLNKAILRRSSAKWDLYINDGVLKTRQNPVVYARKFNSGFSGHSFVLAVAGKQNIS